MRGMVLVHFLGDGLALRRIAGLPCAVFW